MLSIKVKLYQYRGKVLIPLILASGVINDGNDVYLKLCVVVAVYLEFRAEASSPNL